MLARSRFFIFLVLSVYHGLRKKSREICKQFKRTFRGVGRAASVGRPWRVSVAISIARIASVSADKPPCFCVCDRPCAGDPSQWGSGSRLRCFYKYQADGLPPDGCAGEREAKTQAAQARLPPSARARRGRSAPLAARQQSRVAASRADCRANIAHPGIPLKAAAPLLNREMADHKAFCHLQKRFRDRVSDPAPTGSGGRYFLS